MIVVVMGWWASIWGMAVTGRVWTCRGGLKSLKFISNPESHDSVFVMLNLKSYSTLSHLHHHHQLQRRRLLSTPWAMPLLPGGEKAQTSMFFSISFLILLTKILDAIYNNNNASNHSSNTTAITATHQHATTTNTRDDEHKGFKTQTCLECLGVFFYLIFLTVLNVYILLAMCTEPRCSRRRHASSV